MKIKAVTESHYEDRSKYVIDTQTGEVVDGPFERYSEIPLRLMGFDGGHKVVSGAELNGRPEEDLDEASNVDDSNNQLNIALIGRENAKIVDKANKIASSGNWKINKRNYDRFKGGRISLHDNQNKDSFWTGIITDVVDAPDEPDRALIYFKLDGWHGNGKVVNGRDLPWGQEKAIYSTHRNSEDLDEAGYGSYVRSYNNNRTGFSRPQRDMSDESNLMYVYREERLKQGMIDNPNRDRAHAEGFRDTPEQALRLHGIIRSKFDPKKWIQKQGTKWVEVHPYGKDAIKEAVQQFEASIDSLIGKYK